MSAWTADTRRALIVLTLPLASFFGTLPDGGAVGLGIESTGGNLPAPLRPSVYEFPNDVCANLANYVVMDKNKNGKKEKCFGQPQSKCEQSTSNVLLKVSKAVVTTTGTKVEYKVCSWDPTFVNKNGVVGQCRNAALSYFCHTSCDGVPTARARSAGSPTGIITRSKSKLVRGVGGDFGWSKVSFTEQALISDRRQLAVSPPVPIVPKEAKRQLANVCPAGGTEVVMSNGKTCCEIVNEPLEIRGADELGAGLGQTLYFKQALDGSGSDLTVGSVGSEGLGFQMVQTCEYKDDICDCSVSESLEPVAGVDLLCTSGLPVPWGIDGV